MNSQQYNRANKRVFLAVIIVFAYIAFTLFAAVGTKDADITRISIQLVAAIAVIVIAVIAFITKRDSRTGALILVSAMTAGYFIIALILPPGAEPEVILPPETVMVPPETWSL